MLKAFAKPALLTAVAVGATFVFTQSTSLNGTPAANTQVLCGATTSTTADIGAAFGGPVLPERLTAALCRTTERVQSVPRVVSVPRLKSIPQKAVNRINSVPVDRLSRLHRVLPVPSTTPTTIPVADGSPSSADVVAN